jgi:ribosomal protein L24E
MKQIEKRQVEVTYCDWCHKEIPRGKSGYYEAKEESGLILHFHDKCFKNYEDLKSKEVKQCKEKPLKTKQDD